MSVQIQSQTLKNSKTFTIETNSTIMDILSNRIYKNRYIAFIREIMCNANDAHKENPLSINRPIEVLIDDNEITIKDYGLGLHDDDIINLYTSYGASTKAVNSQFTGNMGIGSKSPFAYCNSFTVKSYFNGTCNSYYVYKDINNVPFINKVMSQECGDRTGMEVTIPFENAELLSSDAFEYASKIGFFFDVKPIIEINTDLKIPKIEKIKRIYKNSFSDVPNLEKIISNDKYDIYVHLSDENNPPFHDEYGYNKYIDTDYMNVNSVSILYKNVSYIPKEEELRKFISNVSLYQYLKCFTRFKKFLNNNFSRYDLHKNPIYGKISLLIHIKNGEYLTDPGREYLILNKSQSNEIIDTISEFVCSEYDYHFNTDFEKNEYKFAVLRYINTFNNFYSNFNFKITQHCKDLTASKNIFKYDLILSNLKFDKNEKFDKILFDKTKNFITKTIETLPNFFNIRKSLYFPYLFYTINKTNTFDNDNSEICQFVSQHVNKYINLNNQDSNALDELNFKADFNFALKISCKKLDDFFSIENLSRTLTNYDKIQYYQIFFEPTHNLNQIKTIVFDFLKSKSYTNRNHVHVVSVLPSFFKQAKNFDEVFSIFNLKDFIISNKNIMLDDLIKDHKVENKKHNTLKTVKTEVKKPDYISTVKKPSENPFSTNNFPQQFYGYGYEKIISEKPNIICLHGSAKMNENYLKYSKNFISSRKYNTYICILNLFDELRKKFNNINCFSSIVDNSNYIRIYENKDNVTSYIQKHNPDLNIYDITPIYDYNFNEHEIIKCLTPLLEPDVVNIICNSNDNIDLNLEKDFTYFDVFVFLKYLDCWSSVSKYQNITPEINCIVEDNKNILDFIFKDDTLQFNSFNKIYEYLNKSNNIEDLESLIKMTYFILKNEIDVSTNSFNFSTNYHTTQNTGMIPNFKFFNLLKLEKVFEVIFSFKELES